MKMCGDLCLMVAFFNNSISLCVSYSPSFTLYTYVHMCVCVSMQYSISIAIFRARGIALQLLYPIDNIFILCECLHAFFLFHSSVPYLLSFSVRTRI